MGTPRSPWMVKVYELLADGAWHDRETVVVAAMPLVPPGKAARTAVDNRDRMAATRRQQGVPVNPSQARRHDDQAVGARTKVTHSISAALSYGHLQRRIVDGRPQIRLTPQEDTPT